MWKRVEQKQTENHSRQGKAWRRMEKEIKKNKNKQTQKQKQKAQLSKMKQYEPTQIKGDKDY